MVTLITLSPLGLAAAFGAGFLSFVSPCVWPLIPGYLSFVSGVAHDDLGSNARRVTAATGAFVAGFALVFSLYGAGIGLLGSALSRYREALELVGGLLVVLFGLMLLGAAGSLFGRSFGVRVRDRPVTLGGAFAVGVAFAIGWTPCIGATLGAILTLAADTGGAREGAALLFAYSLGLGLPFLAAGLSLSSTLGALAVFRRHRAAVNRVAGGTLVVVGVLLATGRLTEITQQLARFGTPV